jgi:hypothetical protein
VVELLSIRIVSEVIKGNSRGRSDCLISTCILYFRFVYSDDPQIDGNNVLPCLYAAKKYQLSGLVKLCSDFLENNVDVNNVCHINEQATIYQMKTLQDKCIAFIMKNATSVLCSPGVLEFSHATLLNVLKRDELACDEMYVFKAARRWAEHNCEVNSKSKTGQNIRDQLGEALFEIRFPIMPIEEFARVVTPSGILTNDEIVMLYQFNATKGSSLLGKFRQQQRLGAKIAIELNQDNSNLLKRQNTRVKDEFRAAVERAREIADRINKK